MAVGGHCGKSCRAAVRIGSAAGYGAGAACLSGDGVSLGEPGVNGHIAAHGKAVGGIGGEQLIVHIIPAAKHRAAGGCCSQGCRSAPTIGTRAGETACAGAGTPDGNGIGTIACGSIGLCNGENAAVELLTIAAAPEALKTVDIRGKLKQAGGIAQSGGVGGEISASAAAAGIGVAGECRFQGFIQGVVVAVGGDDLRKPAVYVKAHIHAVAFDVLDEFRQRGGFPACQRGGAVIIPGGGIGRPICWEAAVHVDALGIGQIAAAGDITGGQSPGAVVAIAGDQAVGVHGRQHIYCPVVVVQQGLIAGQKIHHLTGGIDQRAAVFIEIVFIAVDFIAQHHDVFAGAELIGHQRSALAGGAVCNGFCTGGNGQI